MLKPGDFRRRGRLGGPDSICLLSILQVLAKDYDLGLHIAHLDHMFRGKESTDEALFVAEFAKKLGIPVTVEKIDVPSFCREYGLSPQEGLNSSVQVFTLSRKRYQGYADCHRPYRGRPGGNVYHATPARRRCLGPLGHPSRSRQYYPSSYRKYS